MLSRGLRVSQGYLIREAKRNKTKGRWKSIGQLYSCSFLSRYSFVLFCFYKGGFPNSGLSDSYKSAAFWIYSPQLASLGALQLNVCLINERKCMPWVVNKTTGLIFFKVNPIHFSCFITVFSQKIRKRLPDILSNPLSSKPRQPTI